MRRIAVANRKRGSRKTATAVHLPAFLVKGDVPILQAPAEPTERIAFRLPQTLADELRDAAVHLRGTLDGIARDALQAEIARLKQTHTGSEPFPPRASGPRPGRPIAR